jgi:hypothetical protein
MKLGNYEYVGNNQSIIDYAELQELRQEITRLRAEVERLRGKLDSINNILFGFGLHDQNKDLQRVKDVLHDNPDSSGGE